MRTKSHRQLAFAQFLLGILLASYGNVLAEDAGIQPRHMNNPRLARLLEEARLSPGVLDVARLTELEAGVDVLTAYVTNSVTAYKLRAEDVAYLKKSEVPDSVITAMMERGASLRAEQAPAETLPVYAPVPAPTVVYVPAFSQVVRTPPSTVTVIGSSDLEQGISTRYRYYRAAWNTGYYGRYGSTYGYYGSGVRPSKRYRVAACDRVAICR